MTDQFKGGGLDAITKAAWEEGYKAGAAAERDECVKVCENFQRIAEGMDKSNLTSAVNAALLGAGIARCADAIRARGEK